ncbi:thioredoxin-like protein [Maribacter vaceletii]|uniref:Thioredoxin-like protein n=1 Tax=Maribacter vaceletii TaxID=1206816 RepID=A0A495DTF6_9FLAO|nr:thioredoxin family protein [Maribacter vaceletii]RKR07931.1 thioredoxin-like protein [Maribacter vaceletii]
MGKIILVVFFIVSATSMLFSQEWQTDFTQAKELSSKNNIPIVLVFQGSDWCAPCIKLDKEIWSTEEFKNYAKENFVMLQADFPKKKKNSLSEEQAEKNKALAEQYNSKGYFPFVVVLDKDGNVLGQTSYKKVTPAAYIKLLESFKG